jgi:cyclopropane-fatty-acyl-phospholipid synthase
LELPIRVWQHSPLRGFRSEVRVTLLSFLSSESKQLAAAHSVLAQLAELLDARFSIQLWDGSRIPLGRDVDPRLFISISGPGVISSLLHWPTLDNLLRQYALGRIDFHGGDLIEFGEVLRVNRSRKRLKQIRKGSLFRNAVPFLLAPGDTATTRHAFAGDEIGRGHVPRSERDYIQFHYDLGNEFYQLFLDPEMQYSCGYFTDWNNSLEQAQHDKLEMICRKLRLQPGERLLDIGCGWGGLICHAALHYGVQAHGVTLSQTQYDFAQEKVRRLGLAGLVNVELRDYATLDGTCAFGDPAHRLVSGTLWRASRTPAGLVSVDGHLTSTVADPSQWTVPLILIDGEPIGGYEELWSLERTAALDALLAAC